DGVAAGQVGVDFDRGGGGHGEGGGRTGVVAGVDADGAEVQDLVAGARIVGAVRRHSPLQSEGRAIRTCSLTNVASRQADSMPSRLLSTAVVGEREVHRRLSNTSSAGKRGDVHSVQRYDNACNHHIIGALTFINHISRSGRGGQGGDGDAGQ